MSEPSQREDARPSPMTGIHAYDVLCLNCGEPRGTWSEYHLPKPGICFRCRGGDPRTYGTRDWPQAQEESEQ